MHYSQGRDVTLLQTFLGRLGIYYAKRQYIPRGIEWLWDLGRLLPPASVRTVFDVGANEGQTARAVRRAFPGATVHAFEPVAATFARLQRTHGADPRITLNQAAVSSTPGIVHIQAQLQLSHLVPASAAGNPGVERVAAVTLDSYCQQHGITHIDLLKTDTEGHDLEVLQGAGQLLAAGQIDWVFVEVTFDRHDDTHSKFTEIQEWLASHGMAPWCFYDHCYTHAGRHLLFCNVLFGRRADKLVP